MIPLSDFRSSLIFHLLFYSSQRDDTGEISQHPREAEEVAAAWGQVVLGAGTVLFSQRSSDDTYLTAPCERLEGGCTSKTDRLPCSWHSAPLRTLGSRRRICARRGPVPLFSQLPDFDCLLPRMLVTPEGISSLKVKVLLSRFRKWLRILQLIWFSDGQVCYDVDGVGYFEFYLIS